MKMERDLVNIIAEKKFNELSKEELAELMNYCANEEEFDQMKEVFLSVSALKPEMFEPSKKVKDDLDALFDQTYPKASPVWYMSILTAVVPKDKSFVHQPLVRVAAVALLLIMIYPLINKSILVKDDQKLAKLEQSDEAEMNSVSEQTSEDANNEFEPKANASDQNDGAQATTASGESMELDSRDALGRSESLSSSDEIDVVAGSAAFSTSSWSHPDGIFEPARDEEMTGSESLSASKAPKLLDLLTATF